MFNVLPQEEKSAVEKEYKLRRLVVLTMLLVVTLCIGMVLMFPTYLNSHINNQNVSEALRLVSEELSKGSTKVTTPEEVASLREKITILNASKQQASPYAIFFQVLKVKTANIRVADFVYKKGEAPEPDTLVLIGNSRTRDALTQFDRALEAQSQFASVDLPISNLAKDKDIDFTLTITLRQKAQ